MIEALRQGLRAQPTWVKVQEVNREGWWPAWRRSRIQRRILATRPVPTATSGDCEVRILTWRRDWLNALWTLKSFYYFSGLDLPLYIHDGGLEPAQVAALRQHFPNAHIVAKSAADAAVDRRLRAAGHERSRQYRATNVASLKIFDFFLLSSAESVLSLDSDVLFFKRPRELLPDYGDADVNVYNRDQQYAYSLSMDELERAFGLRPLTHINSGVSRVARRSIAFDKIESWLAHPTMFDDKWVTEQTLHALCSASFGAMHLPGSYVVSTASGLANDVVCKHYPGFFRPLLYREGMAALLAKTAFFKDLGGNSDNAQI